LNIFKETISLGISDNLQFTSSERKSHTQCPKAQDSKAKLPSSPVSKPPPHDSQLPSNTSFSIGGGSGFGAAIARRFGEEGAKVIVTDINVEGGEGVAALNPSNLIFQRMDVTQENDWKTVLELAFSKFGRLDALVNNAGTTYRNKVGYYKHIKCIICTRTCG
jgi:hypothetical protein